MPLRTVKAVQRQLGVERAGALVENALGEIARGLRDNGVRRFVVAGGDSIAATRLMAAVMLVISVSPMLAPLAGSGLLLVTGWRGIFAALLVAALTFVAAALAAWIGPRGAMAAAAGSSLAATNAAAAAVSA